MRFALKTAPQQTTWADLVAVWRAADDIDLFESVWIYDHLEAVGHPITGAVSRGEAVFEAWTTLAAMSALTHRIRIGVMVTAVPYRHPALLAKMAATVDVASDGRLELGLGAGWNEQEAAAYDIEMPPLGTRFDRFDEAIDLIIRLLSGEPGEAVSFAGRHYRLTDAWCEPKPCQRPHPPITVGGGGERRTLRTVARVAQRWNVPFLDEASFARKRAVLADHCGEFGRDIGDIDLSNQLQYEGPQATAATCARLAEVGMDLAVIYLPDHDPHLLEPLADALLSL